jgi:hypothetical protein
MVMCSRHPESASRLKPPVSLLSVWEPVMQEKNWSVLPNNPEEFAEQPVRVGLLSGLHFAILRKKYVEAGLDRLDRLDRLQAGDLTDLTDLTD